MTKSCLDHGYRYKASWNVHLRLRNLVMRPPCLPGDIYFVSTIWVATILIGLAQLLGWLQLFKMGHSRPLFLFSFFNSIDSKCSIQILPMKGFKLLISGIGSDSSTNWATTTAQLTTNLLQFWLRCSTGQDTYPFTNPTQLRDIY